YGGETWNYVTDVETIDRQGVRRQYKKEAFDIGYRYVSLPDNEYFLGAYFKLCLGKKEESLLKIKTMLDQRHRSQPTHLPNCGSVFKNPAGYHAAALIEACGLKGQRVGGAEISEKHANFIVNVNDASAADILELITLAKNAVSRKFGIQLHQEVRVIS
ncbi:MAG: UDP-N-acetylenolpyruvoylglucosamine reductase, partial [Gammaproteobacteria bacterium]|nr:UDP-N-acetylenolpyruvoylglucosamine reductase [Gammaproteobacteria bacterium]